MAVTPTLNTGDAQAQITDILNQQVANQVISAKNQAALQLVQDVVNLENTAKGIESKASAGQ